MRKRGGIFVFNCMLKSNHNLRKLFKEEERRGGNLVKSLEINSEGFIFSAKTEG